MSPPTPTFHLMSCPHVDIIHVDDHIMNKMYAWCSASCKMILVLFKYSCLHDCLQAVDNHYNDIAKQYKLTIKRDSSTTFEFEKSKITLNIPEDGELTNEGWNITPITPAVVCLYISSVA